MILPLRRVHRSVFVALALFLPALLASAWKVRRETPEQELPPELLPGGIPELFPAEDELVYWSHHDPSAARTDAVTGAELPADAELIGTLRSGAHRLAPPEGKYVYRYSLAHGELSRSQAGGD